jgi:hypothetical protein
MGRKAIVIFATNKYFVLGLRLISHWEHHYKSDNKIDFIFISDSDPKQYYDKKNIHYIPVGNDLSFLDIMILRWAYASKIASFGLHDEILMIDADTSINKDFSDENFSSNLTMVKHPDNDNRDWILNHSFENNKRSSAYFRFTKNEVYYNAGLLVASPKVMIDLNEHISKWYRQNIAMGISTPWHDETYINKYAHTVKIPEKILYQDTVFLTMSDKGGSSMITGHSSGSGVYVFDNARAIDNAYTKILEQLHAMDINNCKWIISDEGKIQIVS